MPELQETEVASAHWIPLELLHAPLAKYGHVPIDIATRLAPRNRFARTALRLLVGKMDFKCVAFLPESVNGLRLTSDSSSQMHPAAKRSCRS